VNCWFVIETKLSNDEPFGPKFHTPHCAPNSSSRPLHESTQSLTELSYSANR